MDNMNRYRGTLQASTIALLVLVFLSAPALTADARSPNAEASRVRFLVRWRSEVDIATLPSAAYAIDTYQMWPLAWQIVEVDAQNAATLQADLQLDPRVEAVTVDYPLELTFSPNDPAYADGTQWALQRMGTDIAWEFSRGRAITVAIVDSGIDPTHPDLIGQLVDGYDFYTNSTDVTDPCGHGTHVAGIVAAIADNGIGIAGVAPEARLMPVRVIGDTCTGTYSRLIQGILYAVDHGAQVIVITSGAQFAHTGLRDAIRYARAQNVLVITSAGNRGDETPFYPGSYEESFTVAGTDQNDGRYLNSTHGSQIDVSAPATSIFSTYTGPDTGPTFAHLTGTSMAAPLVAGIAALVLALEPSLSVTDLETVLRQSADDLGDPGWDKFYGWGRANAWRAAAAVSSAAGNAKLGNARIPVMAAFDGVNVITTNHSQGVHIAWTVDQAKPDTTAVLYRATVPVFEAAVDVAEVALHAPAATGNSVIDTQVVAGQTYHYWIVQADRSVESAISSMHSVTYSPSGDPDEEPIQPSQPTISLYLPLARGG
jgi:thermitase